MSGYLFALKVAKFSLLPLLSYQACCRIRKFSHSLEVSRASEVKAFWFIAPSLWNVLSLVFYLVNNSYVFFQILVNSYMFFQSQLICLFQGEAFLACTRWSLSLLSSRDTLVIPLL